MAENEKKSPYRKSITYFFDAGGENWEITNWSKDYVYMEETRKNGQEDCHVAAEFINKDGKWVLDELDDWEDNIVGMFGRSCVNDIIDYLTEHGVPSDDH